MSKTDKKSVKLFVVIVYVITFALNFYIYKQGGYASLSAQALVPLQMLIPALMAVGLIIQEKGKFRDYGWRFGEVKS